MEGSCWKKAWKLFLFYAKIGIFTFGGGWGILAEMRKEFVEKEQIITDEELLDVTSVGRSLPGTMIGNVSFLFGYHIGGPICGFAALIGMIFWPFLILSVITFIYARVLDNIYVARAMVGIRAAVVPIMVAAIIPLGRQALQDRIAWIIMGAAFLLCSFGRNNILAVVLGAITGYLIKGVLKIGSDNHA